VIKNFHNYVKSGKPEDYEEYVRVSLESNPVAIKDLLNFKPATSGPIPIEEVEPVENIRRRFTTAAMSLGALSPEAHEPLAIAMNRIGGSRPFQTLPQRRFRSLLYQANRLGTLRRFRQLFDQCR
jgi:glutamate synthase (NADPH/NADH) large chain/glutamate synthase (ferredoxin)